MGPVIVDIINMTNTVIILNVVAFLFFYNIKTSVIRKLIHIQVCWLVFYGMSILVELFHANISKRTYDIW